MNHLKAFQRKHSLVPDGILGRITMCKMIDIFKLPSIEAAANFLGQIAHESGNFKHDEENLNYSAKALLRVFPNHFESKPIAKYYEKQPVKIANKVYANRMGNGNEFNGEGWLYRGRGAIQLTGKDNYQLFGDAMQMDFICYPNLVKTDYFFESALWYFNHRNLWQHCDHVNIFNTRDITRKINGGFNGLDHRYNLTSNFYKMLQ